MAKRRATSGSRSRSSARKTARGGTQKAAKSTRKTASRESSARAAGQKGTRKGSRKAATASTRKTGLRKTSSARTPGGRRSGSAKTLAARKTPALNRPRRTVGDDDLVPTPPSSLDMPRSASAARTGRREMKERRDELTQTGPAMTGGDVDADWESAYSVGDEAPGGDNPTPDQDIVDDIGRAVGVEYEDNEELKGADKVAKRDRHRWELDPASSEDYNDRD
jgi:hypothetical protein